MEELIIGHVLKNWSEYGALALIAIFVIYKIVLAIINYKSARDLKLVEAETKKLQVEKTRDESLNKFSENVTQAHLLLMEQMQLVKKKLDEMYDKHTAEENHNEILEELAEIRKDVLDALKMGKIETNHTAE